MDIGVSKTYQLNIDPEELSTLCQSLLVFLTENKGQKVEGVDQDLLSSMYNALEDVKQI